MTDDARNRLLILGFPRSGTTLLSRLLDAHPEISCPPETNLMSAAARFLSEQRAVEGPSIGVLSGMEFLGIPGEEVKSALRDMVFGLHARVAGGAPVWIEKTAVDIFYLERLEELLAGHARFILLTRNPLDVIPSNMDLAETMGGWLEEIHAAIKAHYNPYLGLAHAWVDRMAALDAFAERAGAACFRLRYEELTQAPEAELADLLDWIGVAPETGLVARALSGSPRVGLGDFRINATAGIRPSDPKAWRKRLPRGAAAQIVPVLAETMARHGYDVPRVPKPPSREAAVRQFQMAAQLRRSQSDHGEG